MEFMLDILIKDFIDRTNFNYIVINSFNHTTLDEQLDLLDLISESDYLDVKRRLESRKHYFELTHVLNSLFGILIVPFEAFFSNRRGYEHGVHGLFDAIKEERVYQEFASFIEDLKDDNRYCTNYHRNNDIRVDNVTFFLYSLRNSLSHSGNEGISFYPLSLSEKKDPLKKITHVIFRDSYKHDHNGKTKMHLHETIIMLHVSDLERVYRYASCLFRKIDQGFAFTPDEYKHRVNDLIGKLGYVIPESLRDYSE